MCKLVHSRGMAYGPLCRYCHLETVPKVTGIHRIRSPPPTSPQKPVPSAIRACTGCLLSLYR